jgi:hypothetical protein
MTRRLTLALGMLAGAQFAAAQTVAISCLDVKGSTASLQQTERSSSQWAQHATLILS